MLRGSRSVADAAEQGEPEVDDLYRALLSLAEDGGVAAERVLAYLRTLQGAGDGAFASVPPRLGPWREWVPPRGHLVAGIGSARRIEDLPQPRRFDPGE